MHIKLVELQNFRKLKSIRIDFDNETTMFVGANNSGKTSGMNALGHFLVEPRRFSTHDFILSNWAEINRIGQSWEPTGDQPGATALDPIKWNKLFPALDVWLEVEEDEIHYVSHLLPTLDWELGPIGVRIRFEPKDWAVLQSDYLKAREAAKASISAAKSVTEPNGKPLALELWPRNFRDFLDRKLHTHFRLRSFVLDVSKRVEPKDGRAAPQELSPTIAPLDSDPLKGLIRIDEIGAQRGFDDIRTGHTTGDLDRDQDSKGRRRLSEQLRTYYSNHLDPSEFPEAADLEAIQAVQGAEKVFDERLKVGFDAAVKELESMNYPGITDPKLKISSRLRPTDALSHRAAVQYEISSDNTDATVVGMMLPEECNGLGYQNLISMVFRLMSFRDAWMQVGKARMNAIAGDQDAFRPPLHLVLVEEPEAHLHVQVQQVFVRKAYDVLRNHKQLGENKAYRTQLVISTHSSHVAHETSFASLRYFRRLSTTESQDVPISVVINLSSVFGNPDETTKFVKRYLRAAHCDLFFADAAILVEGSAERILVPHFIRNKYRDLNRFYLTIMEVGGSHAHRLRNLIEHLALTTLVITDLDSAEPTGRHKSVAPKKGANQVTTNATLKKWHPEIEKIDELMDLADEEKVKVSSSPSFKVRIAYQMPVSVKLDNGADVSIPTKTFEDSLALENASIFRKTLQEGSFAVIRDALAELESLDQVRDALFKAVKEIVKAEFALDILSFSDPKELVVPKYIADGLEWLENQFKPTGNAQ